MKGMEGVGMGRDLLACLQESAIMFLRQRCLPTLKRYVDDRTPRLARGFMLAGPDYERMQVRSVAEGERFWMDYALERVDWFKKPTVALDSTNPPFHKWFPDGELNLCYNAVDRHVLSGRGSNVAIAYESAVGGDSRNISYDDLQRLVSKFAGSLMENGVGKGDRVIVYMPMVPEAIVAMLACNRIGAIHSVVFGGFAALELSVRIDDATPKAIVTSSCGVERNEPLPYIPLLHEAVQLSTFKPKTIFVHQRPEILAADMSCTSFSSLPQHLDFYESLENAAPVDCVALNANDPLYILYTSGTTGAPKGILRDNTHTVPLQWTMDKFMKVGEKNKTDVYWAASDIGWVVGHSYIAFAPLIQGCTSLLYEGKPVGTPDAGAYWRIVEEHKVKALFTAPTALRAIRKEDPSCKMPKQYDISSLEKIFLAGERCDPDTINFFSAALDRPMIDHWWQTETGWPISGFQDSAVGMKAGSSGRPLPGFDLKVLDPETGDVVEEPNTAGALAIKMPLPPGCMTTLYNNADRYEGSYFTKFGKEYYETGDAGHFDADGYVHVMARTDDVINVAGHRLSTGALEEAVSSHPDVVECAVIGVHDSLKGNVPVGLYVMSTENEREEDEVSKEIIALVRERIGAVAAFKSCAVVPALPKTRSGKILRNVMRNIADNVPYTLPGTIEDPAVVNFAKEALAKLGFAKKL